MKTPRGPWVRCVDNECGVDQFSLQQRAFRPGKQLVFEIVSRLQPQRVSQAARPTAGDQEGLIGTTWKTHPIMSGWVIQRIP